MAINIQGAASLIVAACKSRQPLTLLPVDCRPTNFDEAYEVQDLVAREIRLDRGWKIATPPPHRPLVLFGPLVSIVDSPARLAGPEFRVFGIEAEIAIRFSKDIPSRPRAYARNEVLAAVGTYHPAIEVVDPRFADRTKVDIFSFTADLCANGALVLGTPGQLPNADLARLPAEVRINGKVIAKTTEGNVGGDPIELLVQLVNHVTTRGGAIAQGTVVTTGTLTGLVFAHADAHVVAEFGSFGSVELRFG